MRFDPGPRFVYGAGRSIARSRARWAVELCAPSAEQAAPGVLLSMKTGEDPRHPYFFRKLGVADRPQAITLAVKRRIVPIKQCVIDIVI